MALLIVINQPASSLDGRDIYIGPTAVDFSCSKTEKCSPATTAQMTADSLVAERLGRVSLRSYWQKPHAREHH